LSVRVGIDTGGTFNDFVAVDEETGQVWVAKVPSTPSQPAEAVARGLARLEELDRATQVTVGTTVATNAVIQRQGPRVLLVTNRGFGDVAFIGRMDKEQLYDLHWNKPKPLVKRRDVLEVACRLDHTGRELEPLTEAALGQLRAELALRSGENVVVAICLLFSYVDPGQERRLRAVVEQALPGVPVSVSHQVSPLWREYERTSTTIADAFVKPVVGGYVEGVGKVLKEAAAASRWNLLASNGGYIDAGRAIAHPAQLLLSGLAGGVIGASLFARAAGLSDVFTLDMGGTSCDIGLVAGAEQAYATEFALAFGIPISIPCVAVQTIGAGGGSIAWIDKGGLLHVGPQSAGADPGPVAYGTGGTQPTLTDANLVLGRLAPDTFLGGEMPLEAAAAREACRVLGAPLGLSAEEAALAAVRIADENMANAIRLIAVERGLDPREFALIAFGGAGPLHARAVAQRLEMKTVLVPPHPGVCSAFGAAVAQARIDRVRTMYGRSDRIDLAVVARAEKELRDDAVAELRRSVDVAEPLVRRSADMRYAGQNYELEVPILEELDATGWPALLDRFAGQHRDAYGFELSGETVELTQLRVTVTRSHTMPPVKYRANKGKPPRQRQLWLGEGPVEGIVMDRESLEPGDTLEGPAILEEKDSTTLLLPGDRLRVHESGVLVITLGEAS
jgi:N-methylhydantoinase A